MVWMTLLDMRDEIDFGHYTFARRLVSNNR